MFDTNKLKCMSKDELIVYVENYYTREINNLYTVIESISDGIYITDGFANTIFVNESYEEISGTDRKFFLGKNMNDVVKEGLIDRSATLEVLKNRSEITMNQVLNNGKEVLITGTPIFDNGLIIDKVVTVVRDITTLNALQNEIAKKQEKINLLKFIMGEENELIYRSKLMKEVAERARKIAIYETTVLITGETGVGKGVVAKLIHKSGNRKNKPFIEVNCSAIPSTLIESELFGYEPGSFTGASKSGKKGVFELANGGTIFLDEIGEMFIEMQAKLLKVIQDKEFYKVGGEKSIPVDIRIITATNSDLEQMIEKKTFREDLYYRLNVIPINIPPLRNRREDIIILIKFFLEEMREIHGEHKDFNEEVLEKLYNYDWPGNVRELQNLVERLYILSPNVEITLDDLPKEFIDKCSSYHSKYKNLSLKEAVEDLEKNLIENALKDGKTHKEAAKELGIDASTLTRKKQRYMK